MVMRQNAFDIRAFIQSEIMDVPEIAVMYNKHRRTIEHWLERDPPPFIWLGNKRVYIRSLLLEWRTPKLKGKR